jgi:GNAT superfamily N-acetyltransferase
VRACSDARAHLSLTEVTRPDDPRLAQLAELLLRTFLDPNSVLGLERMQQFLTESDKRIFNALVAEDDAGHVTGGSVFSYVPASNCGFSEYLVLEGERRGRGIGRQLFDRRAAILDAYASRHGHLRCAGLFIEVDNPERTPSEMLEADRASSIDAYERLRIFAHLGFLKVDVAYVQPPLGPGKQPVDYLDLLFAPSPWHLPMGVIPVESILTTLDPIWSAWTPDDAARYLAELRERIGPARLVSLLPLSGTAK